MPWRSEISTSWRLSSAQQYLWLASSALAACFRIDPHRSQQAAKELLGEEFGGFVVTDRMLEMFKGRQPARTGEAETNEGKKP